MDIERTVKELMEDRLSIDQLDGESMELVADYIMEVTEDIDESYDETTNMLLDILDKIGDVAEHRIVAMDTTDFDDEIDASISRGNYYFELEDYVVQ